MSRNWSRKMGAVAALLTTVCIAAPATADGFTLEDIAEISNKTPINVALEAGGAADLIIPYLQQFSDHTGVPVTHESMVFATLYSKVVVELQSGTGAYDLVVTETSWTNEWEDFLFPMEELAETYDPDGVEGFRDYIAGHDPGILRMASTRTGNLVGVPYYTYTQVNIFREDVFEDETERADFEDRYGYELAPPTTYEELRDQAEFFTRERGETLKGEELDKNIYGVSLMAGRFPHVQDEVTAMLWGQQGRWARKVEDDNGDVTGFRIDDEDMDKLQIAFERYQELMQFAPPGSENAFWDFATAQFVDGNTIMMPFMYNSLWNWASDVRGSVDGARAAAAPVIGERPYTGAFHFSPSRDSGNPEAAYWLLKYIGSYETQKEMAEKGWASARRDSIEAAAANTDVDPDVAYKSFGWIEPTIATWDAQYEDVDSYLHFNSRAFGKLYEEMTIIAHENAVESSNPEQAVQAWRAAFERLQGRFDDAGVVD